MNRFTCASVLGFVVVAGMTACGASTTHRRAAPGGDGGPDGGDTGGQSSSSGGSGGIGTGGKPGTGGVNGTGGAGGLDGSVKDGGKGGATIDAGTGGATIDAGTRDASVSDGSVSTDAGAEAGTRCVDAGNPGCAWIQLGEAPFSGETFTVNLGPGAPKIASATVLVNFLDCSSYSSEPPTASGVVDLVVDNVNGVLTADVSSINPGYNDVWVESLEITVTPVCGLPVQLNVSNNGNQFPNNCSDSFSADSCINPGPP